MNQHVNNVTYIGWVLEVSVPLAFSLLSILLLNFGLCGISNQSIVRNDSLRNSIFLLNRNYHLY